MESPRMPVAGAAQEPSAELQQGNQGRQAKQQPYLLLVLVLYCCDRQVGYHPHHPLTIVDIHPSRTHIPIIVMLQDPLTIDHNTSTNLPCHPPIVTPSLCPTHCNTPTRTHILSPSAGPPSHRSCATSFNLPCHPPMVTHPLTCCRTPKPSIMCYSFVEQDLAVTYNQHLESKANQVPHLPHPVHIFEHTLPRPL